MFDTSNLRFVFRVAMNVIAISQLTRTVDVTRAFVVAIVAIVVIVRLIWIELREIGIGSRSYRCNDMRGTNIDYMCVTLDTMVQRIEADRDGCLAFGEQ